MVGWGRALPGPNPPLTFSSEKARMGSPRGRYASDTSGAGG